MASVRFQAPSGEEIDLSLDGTIVVHFPGVPPRSIRVRDLATVMGTDEAWFEVERVLYGLLAGPVRLTRNALSKHTGRMGRLGGSHAALHSSPVWKTYHRLFGIDDFHSHFRWHAVKRYIDFGAARTLEVGANSGVMTFALAERMSGQIVASEFDPDLLALAERIQAVKGYPNVTLGQADLRTLAAEEQSFDQALVIDVLEHIDDHETAVAQLAAAVRPGGRLVVSVPTPRYPEVFGRAFHESIGHVRDGYWIEDLRKLLEPAGFAVEAWHYYTGRLASWGCSLNYRRGMSQKARLATLPLLHAVGLLGESRVSEGTAASVALLARRLT